MLSALERADGLKSCHSERSEESFGVNVMLSAVKYLCVQKSFRPFVALRTTRGGEVREILASDVGVIRTYEDTPRVRSLHSRVRSLNDKQPAE